MKMDGRYYHAVIKSTFSGETIFLTSFRRVDEIEKELARIQRKPGVKIVKNDW
jgi:hypothetical protein